MQRLGVLGGTFDPIHEGHLALAREALAHGELDGVVFLPMGRPAHREAYASAEDRLALCTLSLENQQGMLLSKAGMRPGVRFTADTLPLLRKEFPGASFTLLIGADKLPSLPYWHEADKLFSQCDLLCFPRSGVFPEETLERVRASGAKIRMLSAFQTPYSASMIRCQIAQYQDPPGLSQKALCYIAEKGLYQRDDLPKLKTMMSAHRFQHTLGVRKEAVRLAAIHGLPILRCALAALLHDCAKGMSLKDMNRVAREQHLELDESTLSSAALLHAPVGAYLAKTVFGVQDEEVLNAIRSHTVGRPGMTKMEMCIFVADATEEGREDYKGLKELRALSRLSLPCAVLQSFQLTQEYLNETHRPFDPVSLKSMAYIQSILTEEEKLLLINQLNNPLF